MSLDKALRKVASKTIQKFGTDIVYKRCTTARPFQAYDSTLGVPTGLTYVNDTIKGRVGKVRRDQVVGVIEATDTVVTFAATSLAPNVPSTTDKVVLTLDTGQSREYEIVNIERTTGTGQPVIFDLFVR